MGRTVRVKAALVALVDGDIVAAAVVDRLSPSLLAILLAVLVGALVGAGVIVALETVRDAGRRRVDDAGVMAASGKAADDHEQQ
jgi:hypothetical protein